MGFNSGFKGLIYVSLPKSVQSDLLIQLTAQTKSMSKIVVER